MKYVRQFGRSSVLDSKSILLSFGKSNSNSTPAYLQEPGHSFGSPDEIMVLQVVNKGSFINTTLQFYIGLRTKKNNQINDKPISVHNKISDKLSAIDNTGYEIL
jgi:hypothetical protein